MTKAKKNGVWIATLDRFGYDLTVASDSKKKCREALSAEYQKAYAGRNGSFDMSSKRTKNTTKAQWKKLNIVSMNMMLLNGSKF